MGRKTLQLEVVDQENKRLEPGPARTFGTDDILDELEDLAGRGAEISGRVYRIENPQDPPTTQKRVYLCEVDTPVNEDYISKRFGGGVYKLRYKARTNAGIIKREMLYRIDGVCNTEKAAQGMPQAAKTETPEPVQAQPQKGFLDVILNGLTAEKITAFGIAIKAIKELFTPAQTQAPDYMRLIEILAGNQQKQSVSDAILIKCMESMDKQHQAPTILQQIKDLQAVKDAIKDETENQENGGDNMNYIKLALELLPMLLKQNQNNFRAVGQQAAQNPMIQNLIKNDINLATQFVNAARAKYGDAAAQQLALGFGYVPQQAAQAMPKAAPFPENPGAHDLDGKEYETTEEYENGEEPEPQGE